MAKTKSAENTRTGGYTANDLENCPDDLLPTPGEFPGQLKEIAELIGSRNTILLSQQYRGCHVYFRNIESIIRETRNKELRRAYSNGATAAKLARIYRLSQRQVFAILAEEKGNKDRRPGKGGN